MPQIILVKQNGQRIYINYTRNPAGSNIFEMQIPGVEIRHHPHGGNLYNYLWFPPAPPAAQPNPDDIEIHLTGPLVEDFFILPLNGGQIQPLPPDATTEITVKLH